MPKIQWTGLPAALRNHLFERLRVRKISAEDLYVKRYSAIYIGTSANSQHRASWPRPSSDGRNQRDFSGNFG